MSHACNDFCCHPPRRKWFQFEDAHHTWCEIFVFFVCAVAAIERLFALRSILPLGKQCSRRGEKLKCTATSAICTGQAAPKSLKHIVHQRPESVSVQVCLCICNNFARDQERQHCAEHFEPCYADAAESAGAFLPAN
jgi:hypothetical protein